MTSQAPTKQHHWILPTAVADQRVCWWQDRLFVAVWLFASAVFVALCLRVPAGLPYDEPAHFGNVMFIQNEHRLAEVGEPGSTYQSQMPPLYYTVVAIATAPFTEADAGQMLSIMRLLGLPLVLVLGLLGRHLTEMAGARHDGLPTVVGCLLMLHPGLLSVGSSVQNDSLLVVLCMGAVALIVSPTRPPGLGRAALCGLTVSAAVLTKLTALFLAPAAVLIWLWRSRMRAVPATLVFTGVLGLFATWWFVRNMQLYGDLTGRSSLASRLGIISPPRRFDGPRSLARFFRSEYVYFWLPVEYYRNTFRAGTAIELLTVLSSGWAAVGVASSAPELLRKSQSQRAFRLMDAKVALVVCAGLLYSLYCYGAWVEGGLSGRHLYPMIVLPTLLLAAGWYRIAERTIPPFRYVPLALFAAINLWVLIRVTDGPSFL